MGKKTCFLIDDDEDDRDIFAMALENASADIELAIAKNGLDAVKHIEQNPGFNPEFIFIDLNMPYISGIECLEKIKLHKRLIKVPVIMYTTSSYQKDVQESKELGASHFLVKPSGMAALTRVLANLLGKNELPFFINCDN